MLCHGTPGAKIPSIGNLGDLGIRYRLVFRRLQEAFQQQPHFAEFDILIDIGHGADIDAERPVVVVFLEQGDQFPVFHFALAYPNLELIFAGVSEPHVAGIFDQRFQVCSPMRAVDIMAGVQGQTKAFDLLAEDDGGGGVFGHPAYLGMQSQNDPFEGGYGRHFAESFDLCIKRGAQF